MGTTVFTNRFELDSFADTALKAATRFWFVVIFLGQLMFAFTIASLYGLSASHGNFQVWNKAMTHGYVPGDGIGNFVVVVHLASAFIIILAGTLQLIPQIRNRAPVFHRWNGRLYILTAFTISIAGLYMMWVRGTVGDFPQHLGNSLMAVLIMFSAVMALRYALARNFTAHRRWALRLYLIVSASLFIRASIFLSIVLNHGSFGFDPDTFSGPFLTFISFAQYLVPLAVLELYFRAQERPGAFRRMAMAAILIVLTLAMGAGILAVAAIVWLPNVKAAFDPRKSVAQAVSDTLIATDFDHAKARYYELKSTQPAAYNFDEVELNILGYQLLRARKFDSAIRVLQLNVEAYPQSSNAYDSLGEAYMDAGDKPQAIAYYRKALEKNPQNQNSQRMLRALIASEPPR